MAKKFYITTAIDYVNGPPHIGHALEKIQADVLARHHRLAGDKVFFLTGTDEHGATNMRAAKNAGQDVSEFTTAMQEKFKSMRESLDLSWDDFIRTSDKEKHWPGVFLMWRKLVESGDIYKKKYKGLYCVGHEAFVTKKDLIDGKCAHHDKTPEEIEEENYFFRLSGYSEEIGGRIRNGELEVIPKSRENEILSLIEKEGLEDVSFSRPRKDLSWGIPVPGDDSQTIYVWCDALANYLSALGYGRNEEWKKFWPADVQVIGKDILRFHAAIWPGMLLSAKLPLPKKLFVHGFINVEGRKMSKTVGNIIDPFAAVQKYGADAVRYYLLREIPSGEDGDWSEVKFRARYNADLANGLGNFAARVLALAEKAGITRSPDLSSVVEQNIKKAREIVGQKTEEFKFHEALSAIWDLISFGDEYVNSNKPWLTGDKRVIFELVTILENVAVLLLPFLPATSEKITASIRREGNILRIKRGEVLFSRLK